MNTTPHSDPAELVAGVIREHVPGLHVRYIPTGSSAPIETTPTIQVRALLAPPPRHNRVSGAHQVTVRLSGINPDSHDNLLLRLPQTVNRSRQVIGSEASILHLDQSPMSSAMAGGGMAYSRKVRVTLAERVPVLVGEPYLWRIDAEARRLGSVAQAPVSDVLHGVVIDPDGVQTTTLTGRVAASAGLSRRLRAQVGHHIDGIGGLSAVELSEVQQGMVSFAVTYRARVNR